jgi:hypothetical protein
VQDVGLEPPVQEPIEEVYDFSASKNASDEIPVDPSQGNLLVNSDFEPPADGAQDQPETMREALQEDPVLDLTDLIHSVDDPMEVDPSPFVQKKVIPSPVLDETSAGQQIPGKSIPNPQTLNTYDSFEDGEQSAFG